MNTYHFKYSPFHKELSKKYIKNIFSHIPMVAILLVFSVLLLQPHKFQVSAKENDDPQEIQALYEEMLANSQQANDNGEIQFETLLVGEDGETKITYTVSPGDTLSKIAKLFGTTVDAIKKANNIFNDKTLRVGTKLIIAYDKSIIHDLTEDISVEDFAKKYQLNIDDLLTLNYFDTPQDIMKKGDQIFVPLNKIEAQERGLIKKRKFVKLDIPEKPSLDEQIDLRNADIVGTLSGGKQIKNIPPHTKTQDNQAPENIQQNIVLLSGSEYQQKIISAEDTEKYLQQIKQAKKEAEIAKKKAEELQKQAKEAERQAKLLKEAERIAAEKAAAEKAEKARLAFEEAEKKAKLLAEAEAAEKKRIAEEKEKARILAEQKEQQRLADLAASCTNKQCYHDGKCRSKPEHATCSPEDDDNAWVCEAGFIDTGRSCITSAEQAKKVATATAPKKKAGVLKQRYFNPYKEGYSNGRGGGHCTHYAGYYRHAKLGKETNWRGNAKYRYANANAAGRRVGQTPTINSIVVMKYGSQGWNGYGHVGIVIDIDRASRQILIEDMNYVGRYIVSQHRIDLDSTRNPVIGFVYPD